jgi:hypothetical protein
VVRAGFGQHVERRLLFGEVGHLGAKGPLLHRRDGRGGAVGVLEISGVCGVTNPNICLPFTSDAFPTDTLNGPCITYCREGM